MSKEKVVFDRDLLSEIENYSLNNNLELIELIDKFCIELLKRKDSDYGGSWQKDGILSAHLNTKRKFDRLHNIFLNGLNFDTQDDTVLDTLVDLRNYVTLYIVFMVNKDVNLKKLLE